LTVDSYRATFRRAFGDKALSEVSFVKGNFKTGYASQAPSVGDSFLDKQFF